MGANWNRNAVTICYLRLREWSASLQDGLPVNVGLFDMVAEEHVVDIYTLEPQRNPSMCESLTVCSPVLWC